MSPTYRKPSGMKPGDEITGDNGLTFRVGALLAYQGKADCQDPRCTRVRGGAGCRGYHCATCNAAVSMMGHNCPEAQDAA